MLKKNKTCEYIRKKDRPLSTPILIKSGILAPLSNGAAYPSHQIKSIGLILMVIINIFGGICSFSIPYRIKRVLLVKNI